MEQGRHQVTSLFTNHTMGAKRRSLGILNAKNKKARTPLYRDLLKVTSDTLEMAQNMIFAGGDPVIMLQLQHFIRLANLVITQTERRVIQDESVPASEKISQSLKSTPTSSSKTGGTFTTAIKSVSRLVNRDCFSIV